MTGQNLYRGESERVVVDREVLSQHFVGGAELAVHPQNGVGAQALVVNLHGHKGVLERR